MKEPIKTRKIGSTEVEVTSLGFGSAPLGDLFDLVDETQSESILNAAWNTGIRYFDTAPFYGHGKSELRVGHFLRQQNRDEFVLSTKVGRVLRAPKDPKNFKSEMWANPLPFDFRYDYSYDGIMRSFEDSLQRLGLNRIDVLLIHDLDPWFHGTDVFNAYFGQLLSGGYHALHDLKNGGQIRAIGAGVNLPGTIPQFLDSMDLDLFIVAMPYTLLDQGALDSEFPKCEERGVGIVIGSPFASGILASGPIDGAVYGYKPASPEILEKTRRIQSACEKHGISLRSAAMQFPLAHPIAAAIIPGSTNPEYPQSNREEFDREIPADFWSELKKDGLIREDAPTP